MLFATGRRSRNKKSKERRRQKREHPREKQENKNKTKQNNLTTYTSPSQTTTSPTALLPPSPDLKHHALSHHLPATPTAPLDHLPHVRLARFRVDGPREAARGHDARASAPDAGPVGDDAAAELRAEGCCRVGDVVVVAVAGGRRAVRATAVRLRGRELRGWRRRGWRLRGEGQVLQGVGDGDGRAVGGCGEG